ncbi:MAG: hypothetical protein R3B94_09265 [Hyphomonas sp.]
MLRIWPLVATAIIGVCFATYASAEPPEAMEEAAAIQDAGAFTAPEETDDPGITERLAFMNTFTQRVRDGDPVADMMSPTFFFVYAEQHECGGYTTAFESAVPASDVDVNFMFPATFAWEDTDCDVPWDTTMQIGFHLGDVVATWGRVDIEAVDADFTQFTLWDRSRNDYLLVQIRPSGATYEVSQIDYRWEYK